MVTPQVDRLKAEGYGSYTHFFITNSLQSIHLIWPILKIDGIDSYLIPIYGAQYG
jgi:hypothetical protein